MESLEFMKKFRPEELCIKEFKHWIVCVRQKIATEQILIPKAGHINSESGYDTFEDIVSYL